MVLSFLEFCSVSLSTSCVCSESLEKNWGVSGQGHEGRGQRAEWGGP